MKKKLALLLAAVMAVGMVPMTAFAATTNRMTNVVTGDDDTTITSTSAPVLKMYEKDLNVTSGTEVTFRLDLTNAEWTYDDSDVNSNGQVTESYVDTDGTTKTRKVQFIENLTEVDVTTLSAKSMIISGKTMNYVGDLGLSDNEINVKMLTDLTDEGEATVTIEPMQSKISSGTYKFATVAAGDATVTIEKKTDVSENGATIKNVVITETTPMSFSKTTGKIKLKLSNDWAFGLDGTDDISNILSVYPNSLAGCFDFVKDDGSLTKKISDVMGDEDIEIQYNFTGKDSVREGKTVIVTIAPFITYDDDEVEPGEICEMTVSGDDIAKTTLEVATAVTYGVTWEAEDKTLPVFYSGELDEEKDTLEVTLEEQVAQSWLTNRKSKIVFPEGIRVLGVNVSDASSNLTPGEFTINDEGNQLTFDKGWRIPATSDKTAEVTFQFQLSVAPDFTGDITATITGNGVGDEISAVVATAVAPVTVEATKTDAIIDYRHTTIGDITITEAEAGLLEKGKTFALEIEKLGFDDDPTVEVVSGDMKLKDVKVKDGRLEITVDSESAKEPAVIKITNAELFMERDIPAGEYALKLAAVDSQLLVATDATGSWTTGGSDTEYTTVKENNDAIFQNSIKSGENEDKTPFFDSRSVKVVDGYVNVVTSGRDQGDNTFTTTLKVTIGATEMYANDKAIALDVPAYISNGYTMLPVRAVTEALSDSAIVRWDDPTHTVTITFGDRVINMVVGSSTMVINGVEVPMQAQCEITDSRAFIPLRDMGYALGLNDSKINWDDATKTATLN